MVYSYVCMCVCFYMSSSHLLNMGRTRMKARCQRILSENICLCICLCLCWDETITRTRHTCMLPTDIVRGYRVTSSCELKVASCVRLMNQIFVRFHVSLHQPSTDNTFLIYRNGVTTECWCCWMRTFYSYVSYVVNFLDTAQCFASWLVCIVKRLIMREGQTAFVSHFFF